MEGPDFSPPHAGTSRPSLGFPLGTALLLIVIFCLSGFFSCCYHWEKLRSLHQSAHDQDNNIGDEDDIERPPSKSKHLCMGLKQQGNGSLPVLMPGDRVPKFIALPCPHQPPREENTAMKIQKLPETTLINLMVD